MGNSVTHATLKGFLTAFNNHDLDAIMGYFAEDCVFYMPRGEGPRGDRFVGKQQVREGLSKRFEGIPDVHYGDDRHWTCGEDVGVSEWTLTGTTTAGEPIEVRGVDLIEFNHDGKITRKDSFWKIVEKPSGPPPVRQLRVVVKAVDYDTALHFYRDVLGLPVEEQYDSDGGARVTILGAGRATLELSNPEQVELIDRVEAEGRPSARIRIALEVDDSAAKTDELVAGGATLVATPRETPWRSLNSRLHAPADLELTLFQELGPLEE
jgi:ketosteroid isomerase-like protein/catechol 2,3-dioxygenase-like lactoylglutathione lyase family enzyme